MGNPVLLRAESSAHLPPYGPPRPVGRAIDLQEHPFNTVGGINVRSSVDCDEGASVSSFMTSCKFTPLTMWMPPGWWGHDGL